MSEASEASSEALDAGQSGPEADQFVSELILGLERAADGETDPEIRSRLRGAAAILSTVGRNVTTDVAANIIVRMMDL